MTASVPAGLGVDMVRVDDRTMRLRRSWPRKGRHLLLEYLDDSGALWAGQWYGDDSDDFRLRRVHRGTSVAAPGCPVALVPEQRLVIQGGGADRKLGRLVDLAGVAGNQLVSHRAERRGVVKMRAGTAYAKVVSPEKTAALIRSGLAARQIRPIAAPRLVEGDVDAGMAVWESLAGLPLHDLGEAVPDEAWAMLGSQLRALHRSDPPAGLPVHDGPAEAAVLSGWLRRLRTFAPGEADRFRPLLDLITRDLAQAPAPDATIHRDLHDKQVLLDERGDLGWIDFDTLSVGEAAIDLANLVVHLDLRVVQGTLARSTASRAAAAFITAYRPDTALRRRAVVYAAATRLRLYCLYAFRPRPLPVFWVTVTGPASLALTGPLRGPAQAGNAVIASTATSTMSPGSR